MNKKSMLIGLVLFLLSISNVFAGASDTDNAISWYSWDDDTTDLSGSGYDFTLFNDAVRSTTQSKLGGTSLYLDGTGDYATTGSSYFTIADDTMTTCAWLYKTDTQSGNIVKQTEGATYAWDLLVLNTNTYQPSAYDGSNNPYVSGTGGSLNTWVHYCLAFDSTTLYAYVDGVLMASTSDLGVGLGSNGELSVGIAGSNYMQGYIDEIAIYDEYKDITGINAIKDLTENPFTAEPVTDEIYPQGIDFEQQSAVEINSNTYQNVYSSVFNLLNDTSSFDTWTVEVEAINKDTIVSCRSILNSTAYGSEVNRTLLSGETGVLYLYSDEFNITNSTDYALTLQCKRDTTAGAKVDIRLAEGILNILTTKDGNNINHIHESATLTLNSTSYQLLGTTEFNTSDIDATGFTLSLITDGAMNYNYVSTSNISIYAEIDGTNSSIFERNGDAGTFGSGAGLSLIKNVTANSTITLKFYGKSTSGDGSVDIRYTTTEILTHDAEVQSVNMPQTALTKSATWTTIETLYINNSAHTTDDIIAKASITNYDTSGNNCEVSFRLNSGASTSQEYTRTISQNKRVTILQHIISNPGLGNTSVELQTTNDCDVSNTPYYSGGFHASIITELQATPQFYRITAQDEANSASINTFNVTLDSGSFFQTVSGFIDISHVNGLDDFNITAENYQTNITLSHDTTTNLTVNMRPDPLEDFTLLTPVNGSETNSTDINITWTQSVSPTGKAVTYNISSIYEINDTIFESFTTTNLSYSLDISAYSSDDYIISVTAIENLSNYELQKNASVFVNRPNFLYFFNQQTGLPIQDANITIDLPSYGTDVEAVTDADGKVFFLSFYNDTLQTGNFNITFEAFIGYVTPITFTETYNSLPVNESFNITVTNINISLFYRSNFSIFDTNATVTIEGINTQIVDNGSVFIQNATITNGDYRITVSADGFFNEEKTFTFTGQDDLDLNIYMLELNSSNSGTVTIRAIDEFSRLLNDAQVNLLEYDTSTLSYLEVSECFTDSNGECKFLVETNTKSYKFTASRVINGQTVTASTEPEIFADSIVGGETVVFTEETRTLTLSAVDQFQVSPLQNIQFSITPYDESFNNVTNQSNIAVSFNSIDGTSITVCVEYFSIASGVKTSLTGNTFCLTGSSGEVTENAFFTLNRSKNYVADIYLRTGNGDFNLDSYKYYSTDSFLQQLQNNAMLPYFIIFIWIFLIGGSMMLKNVSLSGVAIVIGAWVIFAFFPSGIMVSVAVLQTVLGANLVYLGRKREDFG